MKQYFLFLAFIITCLTSANILASNDNQLSEICVEARGNNQFEAKIRALDKGMRRAFIIWADKLGINDEDLYKVNYFELKTAFDKVQIRGEEVKIFSSGAFYKGIVKFTFNRPTFNHLTQKYAPEQAKNKFYKTLVLPVFKIGNNLIIAPKTGLWGSTWEKNRFVLSQEKIYFPVYEEELAKEVTIKNILKLDYAQALASSPVKLFMQVVIPVAEFFTNHNDGSSYLQVKLLISNYDGNTEKIYKYNLPSSTKATQELINNIIDQFIKDYGTPPSPEATSTIIAAPQTIGKAIDTANKQKFYVMAAEIFSDEDLERIKGKLLALPLIDSFTIKPDTALGFKIKLYTDINEEQLAETLYFNGLSFYKKKDYFVLVETTQ